MNDRGKEGQVASRREGVRGVVAGNENDPVGESFSLKPLWATAMTREGKRTAVILASFLESDPIGARGSADIEEPFERSRIKGLGYLERERSPCAVDRPG